MHLRKSAVLISGMGSVGVEIAKNLVLGGVRHVTIQDTVNTSWYDLSAQYFLCEENIGENRAKCSLPHLSELNDSVQVAALTEPITEEMIDLFDLVILTDCGYGLQDEVNAWCRDKGCYLWWPTLAVCSPTSRSTQELDSRLMTRIEQCHEFLIDYVDKVSGDITTFDNAPHNLEDGDYVTFVEVKGMTELNNCEPMRVTVKKPDVFNVGDAVKHFSDHTGCGRGKQVKQPVKVDYLDLKTSRADPELLIWDMAKYENGLALHYLWQCLYRFEEIYNRTPVPQNENDFELFYAELQNPTDVDYDVEMIKDFCFQSRGNLVTVASVVGGIASQEAMKLITHHMTPLKQYMYIDHYDSMPGPGTGYDPKYLNEEDCAPRDHRYDGNAAVFGWHFQEELKRQKWFVVGAGAIGCELLKNFAMMGLCCDGPDGMGRLKITDMDQIEVSNLNRQFLFRRHDVGKKKSDRVPLAVLTPI
ncbi:hypothetical protein L596_005552 [Steinernema carpocapsae]|uniref:THIF-type NAD/FAD binding fold domain-containing protein n=1 Tax=Steinernema carpocapsae TaxID=34508 RepID=A0A4U8UZC7_STECR|nr:hypothetical protein L596_005552 [Steinernema carpocapsae]